MHIRIHAKVRSAFLLTRSKPLQKAMAAHRNTSIFAPLFIERRWKSHTWILMSLSCPVGDPIYDIVKAFSFSSVTQSQCT